MKAAPEESRVQPTLPGTYIGFRVRGSGRTGFGSFVKRRVPQGLGFSQTASNLPSSTPLPVIT